MDTNDLEHQISEAKARCNAIASRRPIISDSFQEYNIEEAKLLELERRLALEKGEEAAILINWPMQWESGYPDPHVFSNGRKTTLAYWVGTGVIKQWPIRGKKDIARTTVTSPKSGKIALVDFVMSYEVRFGGGNDEVIEGQSLYGRGLEVNRAHEVANSKWLREVENMNRVHSNYEPEMWKQLRHYILLFHDQTFQCLAEGFQTELYEGTMNAAITKVLLDEKRG